MWAARCYAARDALPFYTREWFDCRCVLFKKKNDVAQWGKLFNEARS